MNPVEYVVFARSADLACLVARNRAREAGDASGVPWFACDDGPAHPRGVVRVYRVTVLPPLPGPLSFVGRKVAQ